MQDECDFNKVVIGDLSKKLGNLGEEEKLEPFEYYEKELQIGITVLKEAYKIKKYEHAKNIRNGIDGLIEKAEKAARLPEQREKLEKQIKKYSILINVGKILSGPELDKLIGNNEKETYEYHPVTKAFKESADIKLRHKPYHERFSDYKQFDEILCGTIRQLEGMFMRKDLCDQLKLLRKKFYQQRILDEEGIIELRGVIEKAKMHNMGFEDIEISFDLFLKDVLEH